MDSNDAESHTGEYITNDPLIPLKLKPRQDVAGKTLEF